MSSSSPDAVANNSLPKFCVKCKTPGDKLLRCSICKSSYYCNVHCQKAHWKIHKKSCPEIVSLQERLDDPTRNNNKVTIISVETLEQHEKIPDEIAQTLKLRRELGLLELRQGNQHVAMQHFKLAAFAAKGRYVIPHLIQGYKTGLVTKSELTEAVYSCFYWKGKALKEKLQSYSLDEIEAFVKEESQMFDSLDCMNSGMDPIEAFMKAYPGMASQAKVMEAPITRDGMSMQDIVDEQVAKEKGS